MPARRTLHAAETDEIATTRPVDRAQPQERIEAVAPFLAGGRLAWTASRSSGEI